MLATRNLGTVYVSVYVDVFHVMYIWGVEVLLALLGVDCVWSGAVLHCFGIVRVVVFGSVVRGESG